MIKKRTMKYLWFLFIGITIFNCKTSKLHIENNETVFVYFEKDAKNQFIQKRTNDSDFLICRYQFILHDVIKYPQLNESIIFSYRKFRDFDNMEQDNPIHLFLVNKKFIKNNKDLIITLNDMQSIGYDKIFNIIKNAKHVFLIDEADINDNKIIIKEVFLSYVNKE